MRQESFTSIGHCIKNTLKDMLSKSENGANYVAKGLWRFKGMRIHWSINISPITQKQMDVLDPDEQLEVIETERECYYSDTWLSPEGTYADILANKKSPQG